MRRTGWRFSLDGREYFEAYYSRQYAPRWRRACDIPQRYVSFGRGDEYPVVGSVFCARACIRCHVYGCFEATHTERETAWRGFAMATVQTHRRRNDEAEQIALCQEVVTELEEEDDLAAAEEEGGTHGFS